MNSCNASVGAVPIAVLAAMQGPSLAPPPKRARAAQAGHASRSVFIVQGGDLIGCAHLTDAREYTHMPEDPLLVTELQCKAMTDWQPPVRITVVGSRLLEHPLAMSCPDSPVFQAPAEILRALRVATLVGGGTIKDVLGASFAKTVCLRLRLWYRVFPALQSGGAFAMPLLRGHCSLLGLHVASSEGPNFTFGVLVGDIFENTSDGESECDIDDERFMQALAGDDCPEFQDDGDGSHAQQSRHDAPTLLTVLELQRHLKPNARAQDVLRLACQLLMEGPPTGGDAQEVGQRGVPDSERPHDVARGAEGGPLGDGLGARSLASA